MRKSSFAVIALVVCSIMGITANGWNMASASTYCQSQVMLRACIDRTYQAPSGLVVILILMLVGILCILEREQ